MFDIDTLTPHLAQAHGSVVAASATKQLKEFALTLNSPLLWAAVVLDKPGEKQTYLQQHKSDLEESEHGNYVFVCPQGPMNGDMWTKHEESCFCADGTVGTLRFWFVLEDTIEDTVAVDGSKYTFVLDAAGRVHIDRYHEPWLPYTEYIDMIGNRAVTALLHETLRLRRELAQQPRCQTPEAITDAAVEILEDVRGVADVATLLHASVDGSRLVDHPHVVVGSGFHAGENNDSMYLRPLGIINGILARLGCKVVCAVVEDDGSISHFRARK